MGKPVKPVKPAGKNVWDVKKPTYHGSEPRRELLKIAGNFLNKSTKPAGGSNRNTDRPGRGRGRR